MSTHYTTLKKVRIADLFDGRLEEFGIREHVYPKQTIATDKFLTDGRNCLCVRGDESGFVHTITR
jgi:hypothetical protein